MNIYVVLFIMIQTVICQQPCSNFLRNEPGCIQNLIYSCSWNDFMSSCQPSTSRSIGCNISLNRQACVNQLNYPTGAWAYCQFSDHCRDISTTPFVACDPSLAMAACLVVTAQTCIWSSNSCVLASATVIQTITSSLTYNSDLQSASVNICAMTTNVAVVHSLSVQDILTKLVQTYQATQPSIAAQYKAMQLIPGCLSPTAILYSQMSCTFAGLNSLACQNITTAGENCRYVNGQCRTLTDFQTAQCSWQLNINACLSITNIYQQCYWKSICQQGKVTACAAYTYPVSPSWCQAYTDSSNTECFYDSKKQICSSQCRGASLISTAKTCRQSLYGCQFSNGTCLFKDKPSQCGLAGQNRASCMKASENCQFVNGLCKPLSSASLSSVLCTQGLNEYACSAVTNNTQTCQFDNGECKVFKVTSDQVCNLQKVNQNVCQRITYEACYYKDKSCVQAVNRKCTDPGLNLIGCLTTKNTASPCQWSSTMGQCINIAIKPNVSDCNLTLVNDFACRSISFNKGTSAVPNYVYCTYNSILNQCQPLQLADLTNCVTLILNQSACTAVKSGACRWLQGSCQSIAALTATVTCSQLSNVTMPTCALVFANNEPCYYTDAGNRCTSSVIFYNACNQPGLNIFGCSAMTKDPCYFNTDFNTCNTVATTDTILLAKLLCSQTNLQACQLVTTQFQYCMYNTQRSLCQLQVFPSLTGCAQFTRTNKNACLAYYTPTDAQIDETNYCTYDTANRKCVQFNISTGYGGSNVCLTDADINLHVCAKKSVAPNACYFDFSTLKCTANPNAAVLNTILCAQGNVITCPQITTPGQICKWSADNFACQNADPPLSCDTAATLININYCGSYQSITDGCSWDPSASKCSATSMITSACQGLNSYFCIRQTGAPCYYNLTTKTCSQVTSAVSTTLTCILYATNKEGCMALNGSQNTCKWVNSVLQCQQYQSTSLDDSGFYWATPACTDIAAITNFIVNYSVCAMNSDPTCAYDATNNKCQVLSNTAVCQNGNSFNNCGPSCVWNSVDLSCTSSACPTTSVLADCMASPYYCKFTAGVCSNVNQLANCAAYGDGTTTQYTNIMCYQQDPVGTCFPTATYGCTTTATSNCLDIKGPGNLVLCSQVAANCVWNSLKNICTVSTKIATKCEDYTSKYGCLMDLVLICLWDTPTRKCTTATLVREDPDLVQAAKVVNIWWKTCDKIAIMGKAACLSIEVCVFIDKGYLCQLPTNTPVVCSDALGVDQCYKLQTTQLCIWKNLACKSLSVADAANESCFDLFNSAPSLCVAAKKQGQLCSYHVADPLGWCETADVNTKVCTDQLSIYACMAIMTTGQLCVYTNRCQIATPATQLCSDNINIYTCLAITTDNQSCIWMGQLCAPFTGDNFTMTTYSSISQNSCRKAYIKAGVPVLPAQGVKYSASAAACVESDPSIDTCSTGGLNYYGCIQTAADLCTWDRVSMKCISFVDSNLASCASYVNVSARVCELVKDLACYYLAGNCANAPNTLACTQNLSKTACLQQLKSCMWVNNKCQVQDVIPGVTSCVQRSYNTYFLQSLSSVGSCASVVGQACFYNGKLCTDQFDGNVQTCSTVGLNLDGCTQIKTMQCQFVNGQCQPFISQGLGCRQTLNVNALVCATIQEQCKFSSMKRACTGSYQYDSCLSPGLSVKGCQLSKSCIWNPDYQQCTCTPSPTTYCATYSQSLCNTQCIWRINYCALKKCEDLSQTECLSNATLNGYTCYLDTSSMCRSAQTCLQVKNVANCNSITVGTTQCGSYNNGYCQNMICELITNQSLCNGTCQWNGNYCNTLYCSSFNTAATCKGTYAGQSCVFINNLCTGITQCQVLTQVQCTSVTIGQSQCRWQQNNPYSSTYECSSNPCRPIGQSMSNCHGAEVYGQVCVLQSDFSCVACESITDQCNCNQFTGYCLYANNQCSSTLCSYLTKDICALWPQKCQWSSTTSTCIMQCQKFSQTDCQTQQTTSKLCYWDSILSTCQTGVQPQIVIDTVAPLLITVPKYGLRIIIMIIYMFI